MADSTRWMTGGVTSGVPKQVTKNVMGGPQLKQHYMYNIVHQHRHHQLLLHRTHLLYPTDEHFTPTMAYPSVMLYYGLPDLFSMILHNQQFSEEEEQEEDLEQCHGLSNAKQQQPPSSADVHPIRSEVPIKLSEATDESISPEMHTFIIMNFLQPMTWKVAHSDYSVEQLQAGIRCMHRQHLAAVEASVQRLLHSDSQPENERNLRRMKAGDENNSLSPQTPIREIALRDTDYETYVGSVLKKWNHYRKAYPGLSTQLDTVLATPWMEWYDQHAKWYCQPVTDEACLQSLQFKSRSLLFKFSMSLPYTVKKLLRQQEEEQ